MSNLVTIERERLDPNNRYGVIVSQSESLTLLHDNYDFQFDGYCVIRNRDITCCDSSESNNYCERLMRREGLWESVPRWVKKLPIAGWPELVAALIGTVVILEDEVRERFLIGPLVEAQTRHAAIHHFDSCGTPQKLEKISYTRITSMTFGDRYSTIHAKYLGSGGQPGSVPASGRRLTRR
jgi:hypothetical protein